MLDCVEPVISFCFMCKACWVKKMSVPQGAFAAKKIRQNQKKYENQFYMDQKNEASKYNSKYMNSIWGMYNRFSVHNLKKVMDDKVPQANMTCKPRLNSSTLSVSVETINYLPM